MERKTGSLTFDVFGFRRALEICCRKLTSDIFNNFPFACCGDASQLLAAYLVDNGHKKFALISGLRFENDQPTSHAWLLHNRVIIDITIDQFTNTNNYIRNDHTWHNIQFPIQTEVRTDADFRNDSEESNSLLYADYNVILEVLGVQ